LQAVIRLVAAVIATALVARVFHARIGPPEALLLGGVLTAAAVFGLVVGLLAAAGALVAYHSVLGATLPPLDLHSKDTVLLALFGMAVAVVGLYSDTARQGHKQARSLLEAGRPLSPHASGGALEHYFGFAKQRGAALGRTPARIEARRALVGFAIALTGVGAALALRPLLGSTGSALAALAAVMIVAERTGARFGLAAGALAAILLAWPLPAAHPIGAPAIEQVFDAILFAAFGWGVGALSDQLRHERAARQTLTGAGRELSAGADEAAIRRILLESLTRIDPSGVFELRDESGGLLTAAGRRARKPAGAQDAAGWRDRRLEADGRDVGAVRWRFAGATASTRISDEIAASLIDLGASAIVRARLTAEKADMEYVTRAEHLRTVLLDAVSHHFRSPLAGILGSVTSVLNLPEPHDRSVRRQFLLIIKEQANRLGRYVDNFLSLARLESGSIEVNLSEVSVEALIYDVWDTFGEVGGARRYFQVDLDQDVVRSDASLLTQVFGNVLENAIKYSPEESLVEVRAHRDGRWLAIEVWDQGSGVPETSLSRMFDRFYRSQAAKTPGLGLGLYITRSLVEMLGGEVSAHNRDDGRTGLVVKIRLPLVEVQR
jgi:two-component system sensor histidine kinase KdpD